MANIFLIATFYSNNMTLLSHVVEKFVLNVWVKLVFFFATKKKKKKKDKSMMDTS